MKILIIGGVAGGMSAAARLRRLSEEAEITVFEKGGYISFANCGLPYYIGGTVQNKAALILQTPAAFNRRFNVDVRVEHEVLSIDRTGKKVTVKDLKSDQTYRESYDRLILAPGAEPVRPAIPGINHKSIFTVRTIPDTFAIKEFMERSLPKTALIVGGGSIGLEMAENLAAAGMEITIAEALPQVMNIMDMDIASHIQGYLIARNINLILSDGVKSFADEAGVVKTTLASGREITADMVIFSVGVKPETRLASEAGLTVGRGIIVNDFLQTSDPDIYAVGDAIEVVNPITGKKSFAPLAGPANKQGRLAADNIIEGNKKKYPGTLGTAVLKIFDMTAAVTGVSAKVLEAEKMPYESVIVHPGSHAGYYPGASTITLKLIFAPSDGKILGAQAVGFGGVDKRIDVISAYMAKGGTVYDLTAFEHCYAPPYSSAKDAVNMAGFAAENILTGKIKTITWEKIASLGSDGIILDVRTAEECREGMFEGALNIPLDDLRARLDEVPRGKKIAAYCRVGFRSYIAARILMQHEFDVYNLSGGYTTYSSLNPH
jgi:NADPH-dependent 2,4-dienoyl-CoA reductase/sulfur reductase-like enzyme/rhodanese-related sulfurtransferase